MCGFCGRPIQSGSLCQRCLHKLQSAEIEYILKQEEAERKHREYLSKLSPEELDKVYKSAASDLGG